MNYLAHAYLSFGEPEILAGNIFSDFIKGKKRYDFPQRIQEGIALHRGIDEFTDRHAATAKAKEFFKPVYRLYASPLIDIVYDHFLAKDPANFPDDSLKTFSANAYKQLAQFKDIFPENFDTVFYYMQLHDWLYNYQFTWGIFRSIEGLVRRAAYIKDARPAQEILMKNYDALQQCYEEFFPDVREYAKKYLEGRG
jgi:acyl carrier protein phosphodiesterase